jgi:uncharacterized protein YecE (DUF72 family)
MPKVFVGTSGYIYPHWEGIFYPENWPKSKKLEYYCQHFDTVELNNTFYRLPGEKAFEGWYKRTPKNFIFAVKVSRFITHVKKLVDCKEPWRIFLKRALILKEKLGPLLFQLPPFLKADPEKLEDFLNLITQPLNHLFTYSLNHSTTQPLRFAFEFRNESWCNEEVYKILREKNCAWVVVDSPSWPKVYQVTADFVYVRMHGSKILFGSKYTKRELEELVEKIKKWRKQNLDVYVYFNNDAEGFAVQNAKELIKICHG